MELFMISAQVQVQTEADRLYRALKDRLKGLHLSSKGFRFAFKHAEDRAAWVCRASDKHPQFLESLPEVYLAAAGALADFILDVHEERMLRSMIFLDYPELEDEDRERVLLICQQLLKGEEGEEEHPFRRRHELLTTGLAQDLPDLPYLNLEGILRFRLQDYKQELKEVVEYAVDEFWMDRQYEEFMGLLKYFVYFQEVRMPLVHVIHRGGHRFDVLDATLRPLVLPEPDTVVVEMPGIELEMEVEDLILSTLITLSPGQILLHSAEPDAQSVRSICHIFEERVRLCEPGGHEFSETGTCLVSLDGEEVGNYNN
ncbi:putative sporulation protein YtxC [Paenibacillus sp. JX-17]|uniref:Sporulation protein YtxC n=1 Tax=Paenibacillus lacisoli TaxID=3064525 RepID=A0ABT9CDP1_9BACL|nr:putative sporulation protein YtxC [Paenibacillus sp. JX-17]MDO7907371.1 putative sporulation protein YtxC [Paenibacillus sp. JX-17]